MQIRQLIKFSNLSKKKIDEIFFNLISVLTQVYNKHCVMVKN